MSYKFDVYICFGRGEFTSALGQSCDLTRWTEKLVATLYECINPPDFPGNVLGKISFHPRPATGQPLTESDRKAVRESALLVVLMSPNLVEDEARREEIRLFLEQAAMDGRTITHTVLATILPAKFDAGVCPELNALLDNGRRPANSEGFFDAEHGLPIEAGLAGMPTGFVRLLPPIQSLAGEIRTKLESLKGRARARRSAFPAFAGPPDAPATVPQLVVMPFPELEAEAEAASPADSPETSLKPVYLQSASDPDRWNSTRDGLRKIAFINPAIMGDTTPKLAMLRQRDEERRVFLTTCDALVLVRAKANDRTDLHVAVALTDFRLLRAEGFEGLPWVLVDWIDDAGPILQHQEIGLPRVCVPRDADWASSVKQALGFA